MLDNFHYLQTSMRNQMSYSILQTYDNSSKCNFPAFPLINCAKLAKSGLWLIEMQIDCSSSVFSIDMSMNV